MPQRISIARISESNSFLLTEITIDSSVELHTVSVQARNDIPGCSAQSEEGRPILMNEAAVVLRQLQFSMSGPWLLFDNFQGDVYVIPG